MSKSLFDQLIEASGLPEDVAKAELGLSLQEMGKDVNNLDIEDLRALVSQYLQDLILEEDGQSTL